MSEISDLLAGVDPFSSLGDDDLAALAERASVIDLPAGHPLFAHGDVGDRAYVVLEGQLEVTAPGPLQPLILNILGPGDLVGETSLLRGGTRNASVTARTDSRLVAIGPEDLKSAVGAGAGALMRTLLDRWEQTRHQVMRGERMAQLGTLAAGVAHELNNPAAAVRRSSEILVEAIERLTAAVVDAARVILDDPSAEALRAVFDAGKAERPDDPLERATQERDVRETLERMGIDEPWKLANGAVDAGLDAAAIEQMTERLGAELVRPTLELASAASTAHRITGEIGWAAGHMTKVAQDLSSFSRLGDAPVDDVDLVDGLEKTVALLAHRLEDIEVVRDYAADLPLVQAAGSELNQVWANLISNAAQATGPGGRITLRAFLEEGAAVVEVEDNGPGIPSDVQDRIFDAFFTTKPPGSGTGLGLSISHRIMSVDHKGDLAVESEPGRTVFRATIPLTPS
ncbi:MAG TPA: ATP-binding protein [Acidimicrobiia bacterium]|nr:ATP-binding protein [Acidimicrobiia bacterium]